jgi:hypothetical protein
MQGCALAQGHDNKTSAFADGKKSLFLTETARLQLHDGSLNKAKEQTHHVYLPHPADCFNSDSGGRIAHLGPQPKLGLWAKWRLGLGRDYFDRAAVDGQDLKETRFSCSIAARLFPAA